MPTLEKFHLTPIVRYYIIGILLLIFSSTTLPSHGQCFMVIQHNLLGKRNYYPGSDITFQLSNIWYTATIDSLNQNYFFIQDVPIPIKEIQALKVYRKTFNYQATGGALIFGGLFLFAVSGVNYVIANGHTPLSQGPVITSSSAIITGLILLPFNSRTYKINDKNHLVMICL